MYITNMLRIFGRLGNSYILLYFNLLLIISKYITNNMIYLVSL
jgi:hypothetical protein